MHRNTVKPWIIVAAGVLGVLLLPAGNAFSSPVLAQTPRVAPADGYVFHDERTHNPFVVQRWVNSRSPDVSPAGVCDCVTVVYQGSRTVLTLGTPGTVVATSFGQTGQDVNGDGMPEVIASTWSGGAHCCYTTVAYSVGSDTRAILSLSTGNCEGEFVDLDGDRILEFLTCDDQWAYTHCPFAYSPFPRVVLSYDRARREYLPATPRYEARLRDQADRHLEDARKTLAESGGKDLGMDKCAALQPALDLMYNGRFADGEALLRRLYQGPDVDEFQRQTAERVRSSPLWVPR